MSTIRKKPYIEEVLATLNSTQLGQFNALLNGGSANVFKSLVVGSASPLSASDKGIKGVNLELELGKVEAGILIYTDNYCCFCNYHQYQDITVYDVDVANKNYARKYEGCTIEELRRIVGIAQAEAGGETEWEREIKEHLVYNSEDTQVECGTNMEVDGELVVNTELEIGDSATLGENLEQAIIDAAGGSYTAGDGIYINDENEISASVGGGLFFDSEDRISLNNASQNAINAVAGKLNISDVVDNVTSTDTNKALSANQGKLLNDRIDNVDQRGRFLAVWNASNGQPSTLPNNISTTAYTYKTGDYFIVGTAGSKVPSGTTIPAGTTTATFPSTNGASSVANDTIVFDGTNWSVYHSPLPSITFGSITGNVSDNSALVDAFDDKQDTLTEGVGIDITNNTIKVEGVEYKNEGTIQSTALGFQQCTQAYYDNLTSAQKANIFWIIIG